MRERRNARTKEWRNGLVNMYKHEVLNDTMNTDLKVPAKMSLQISCLERH